jgi:16S rRNA (adenine1518-N6/adenine1519-N6)-dimethyltransferase
MANILNKKQIKNHRVKPVKKLGQNYLVNSLIVEQIIAKSEVNKSINVIEIGPGTGNLTKEIAKNCKELICLEIDKKIIGLLTNELKDYKNVQVINDDILNVNLQDIVSKFEISSETWIIANIPYYISSPIIFKFLTEVSNVKKMVIMVQKEFADRMVANVGQKEYNGFSIICNLFSSTRKILNVSRNNFYPVPNVESVVVSVSKKDIDSNINNKEFFQFIRNIFSFKRKTLYNNLLSHYTKEKIQHLKESTNISLTRRAETLTIEEAVLIYKNLYGKN